MKNCDVFLIFASKTFKDKDILHNVLIQSALFGHTLSRRTDKARVFLFFVLQTLPTQFFGNWKENKRDFFQFYFFISLRLMPVQYWSSVLFFRFAFSIAARLI